MEYLKHRKVSRGGGIFFSDTSSGLKGFMEIPAARAPVSWHDVFSENVTEGIHIRCGF